MICFLTAAVLAATIQNPMIVSTEWLDEHLGEPGIVVLEVGDRADYLQGHVPGARFVPRHAILVTHEGTPDEMPSVPALEAFFRNAGVGETDRIVIYSRNPLLASRTWFTLDYLGHGDRASLLDGGVYKWAKEGRRLQRKAAFGAPEPFSARLRDGVLVQMTDVPALLASADVVVLDARPGIEFIGKHRGIGIKRAGHLEKSKCVPWSMHLTRGSEGVLVFRDMEQVADVYRQLGVVEGKRVLLYCRTGVEASMNYFVLRYLGYEPVLYDGSYIEWSRTPENAVIASR